MTWRVILGTVSLMIGMIVLGYVAVTEPDRMQSFDRAYEARQIEAGANLFYSSCRTCHGEHGQGIEGVAPALNAPDLFNGERLKEIKWVGGAEVYVRGAITSGRPRASAVFATYPNRMPAWGDSYGGPLRRDQIESLVKFIMNWGEAYKDAQGNYIPSATATPVGPVPDAVGSDINVKLPAGDVARGKLVTEQKGCVACHVAAQVGPAWMAATAPDGKGVGTHATERFTDAAYTGQATSPEQYLLESIINPNGFVVSNFQPSIMPQIYHDALNKQEVADIIAYLLTLK